MAARCEISGKGPQVGHKISMTRSKVSRRTKRTWKPNLKKVRVMDNATGSITTMKICVKELRNLKKSTQYTRVI
ncbi:MAG: 50S ribosomal protein L28 [Defluviitaleaceae bacterium]|nr:50S ribosomal protein L28 [Defluviitaleaceae bacterium]